LLLKSKTSKVHFVTQAALT